MASGIKNLESSEKTRAMKHGVSFFLFSVVSLWCVAILGTVVSVDALAAQETFPDPTRPATGMMNTPSGSVAPTSGGENGLQTIMLPSKGKPSAIINGERIELGGKYGDARVIKITESSVVLQTPTGLQTLKMVPGVEKTNTTKSSHVSVKKTNKTNKTKAAQEGRP